MNWKESWKNWAIILAIVIGSGLLSAVWPWLTSQRADGQAGLPRPTGQIELEIPTLPVPLPFELPQRLEFHPLVAVAVLAALFIVPTLGLGFLLAVLYVRLDRQTRIIKENKAFQQAQGEVQKLEQERIKKLRENHPSPQPPKVVGTPRWAAISTVTVVVIHVYFLAYLVSLSLLPDLVWVVGGRILAPHSMIGWASAAVTLIVALVALRGQDPGVVDSTATDYNPVPWGWVWVIVSGMLVVGVGLGLVFYFSGPATG